MTALVAAAIIAIVQGWPHWTLFAEAIGVVVVGQFLEGNVISPKLVGDNVGLHPVWLMFCLARLRQSVRFYGPHHRRAGCRGNRVIMRFAVQKYRESHLFMNLPQGQTLILPETVNAPKEH